MDRLILSTAVAAVNERNSEHTLEQTFCESRKNKIKMHSNENEWRAKEEKGNNDSRVGCIE